jgi:hypothetical protein
MTHLMQTIFIILSCGFVSILSLKLRYLWSQLQLKDIDYKTVQIQLHIISSINMLSSSLDVNYIGIL